MTRLLVVLLAWVLSACGAAPLKPAVAQSEEEELLIVAVADRPEPRAASGATPRLDYRRATGYAGSDRALALAASLARDHGLSEVSAWTIDALGLRCMLYRVATGAQRSEVLARLAQDPRVQLAQPQNRFETSADYTKADTKAGNKPAIYNDPYLHLQRGFIAIEAAAAQAHTRGEKIKVAVIDTGIDTAHPDFAGRITTERDFVGGVRGAAERHGTQVAGVIGAAANNGLGIVGVAPMAELLSYRACWASAVGSRCNSFTLAQAMAAAIAAGADVINLSLGGPRDALLERLAEHAMARGAVIVGAVMAPGRAQGFPTALRDVIAVGAVEEPPIGANVLGAPGHNILTLMPGGSYDYVSGSSMATAHVSGAVALLRSLDGQLSAAALRKLLHQGDAGGIDICRAMQQMPRSTAACQP